jgi:hypothetical protein
MSNIFEVSKRLHHAPPDGWFEAAISYLESLGENYEPFELADTGLTSDEPHFLCFSLPRVLGVENYVRGVHAEYQRGEEPGLWYDGHVHTLKDFAVPLLVVKICRAFVTTGDFSIGETDICFVSAIPNGLRANYERALHLPEVQVHDTYSNILITIPA